MTDELQAPAPAEQSPVVETPEPQAAPEPSPEAAEPKPQPTRREALEKAFKTIEDDEPVVQQEPKAEGKSETKEEAGDQPRGPDGKFVAKEGAESTPEAAKTPAEGDKAQKAEPDPAKEKAPLSEAPARFSADAKQAWKDAPEPVRGEIQRAITELETGLAQKDQQLEPLKPFFEMAQQHGVTVHDTMANYVRMEQALQRSPREGLTAIAQNFGMTLEDMIAQATGGETQATEKDREIVALKNTVQQLSEQVNGVTQSVQKSNEDAVLHEVTTFAEQNPRFDELTDAIAYELNAAQAMGQPMSLQQAYDKAERLNPAPTPEPPAPPAPAAQPRQALSVTGAPNAGSNPGTRQPSTNRKEALQRAFSQAGL